MADPASINAFERIVESSPTVVVVLLLVCWLLWRGLRDEIQENRKIATLAAESAVQNAEAIRHLTTAVDKLRERIEDAR